MTYLEKNMAYLHKKNKTYTLSLKKKTSLYLKFSQFQWKKLINCARKKSKNFNKHTFDGLNKKPKRFEGRE